MFRMAWSGGCPQICPHWIFVAKQPLSADLCKQLAFARAAQLSATGMGRAGNNCRPGDTG